MVSGVDNGSVDAAWPLALSELCQDLSDASIQTVGPGEEDQLSSQGGELSHVPKADQE